MLVLEAFMKLDLIYDLWEKHKERSLDGRWQTYTAATRRRVFTFSLWCGFETLLCGITLTAYILLLARSVIS